MAGGNVERSGHEVSFAKLLVVKWTFQWLRNEVLGAEGGLWLGRNHWRKSLQKLNLSGSGASAELLKGNCLNEMNLAASRICNINLHEAEEDLKRIVILNWKFRFK
ncbi:MAG: hypothetical protein ACTS6G_01450 [Candidatus Hodgkinia cicadicola]